MLSPTVTVPLLLVPSMVPIHGASPCVRLRMECPLGESWLSRNPSHRAMLFIIDLVSESIAPRSIFLLAISGCTDMGLRLSNAT